jgi:hypothetical protein
MPYWEFLIQRETDRAWRPLTSRNLQVFEGKYRVIANTSMVDAAVRTQVFYQNDQQPPQLSQHRSQAISPEGMLIVLPFTHLQSGVWHFNCNISDAREVCEQLRLKVVPRPASTEPPVTTLEVSSSSSTPFGFATPPDGDRLPTEILESAVADLDILLSNLDRPPEPTLVPAAGGLPIEQSPLKTEYPLQLDHDIFYGVIGRPLMVTGFANLELLPATARQLVAIVRQPQDGSTLYRFERALNIAERQFAFQMPIELPNRPLNHFLMGEVAIVDEADYPLINSNFTIAYEQPSPPHEVLEDPFAVAFQIVSQAEGAPSKQPGDLSLQEILAATDLKSILDPNDLPMNSYEASSYEVVVED